MELLKFHKRDKDYERIPQKVFQGINYVLSYSKIRISSKMKQTLKETDKKWGFAGDISTIDMVCLDISKENKSISLQGKGIIFYYDMPVKYHISV